MGHLYAMRAAFICQWRLMMRYGGFWPFLGTLPYVIVLAWIARASERAEVVTFMFFGAFLIVVWNFVVARMGASYAQEWWLGTFDFNMISRTPMVTILVGKIMSYAVFGPFLGLSGFLIVVVISERTVSIPNPVALAISLVSAMVAMVAVGFISAPLSVLAGGRHFNYFELVRPLVMIFSGLIFPVALMAPALQIIARGLPTSWAMDGILHSVNVTTPSDSIVESWAPALLGSLIYFGITYLLFKKAEARVRLTGVFGEY